MNFTLLSNLLANIEAFFNAAKVIAPAVEAAFPHAAGGIEDAMQAAAKAGLVGTMIHVAVPELAAGVADEHVTAFNAQLPAVIAAVTAVKTIYDANQVNTVAA